MATGEGRHGPIQQGLIQINPLQGGCATPSLERQQQVEQGLGPSPLGQPGPIEVLLHGEFFDQAQVLPEGANAGLLAAALAPALRRRRPLPEQGAGIGFDQSIGHCQQAAFPCPAGPNQSNPFTALDAELDRLEAQLAPSSQCDALQFQQVGAWALIAWAPCVVSF